MKALKILYLDCETTGLDASSHGIIQIAMLMEIDGKIEGELAIDVEPFDNDVFETEDNNQSLFLIYDDAVTYSKMNTVDLILQPTMIPISKIINFDDPIDAHAKILAFLDKYISKFDKTDKAYLAGYNVQFDRGFISAFFKKCNDNYLGSYLNWKCLDPLYLLWQMDADGEISLENYKLETACKHFGIEIDAHNALSDVKATYELYGKLRGKC